MSISTQYEIASQNAWTAVEKLYNSVWVDENFPEYIANLKNALQESINALTPLSQRSKRKREDLSWLISHYEDFSALADKAWRMYSSNDLSRAIQPRCRFDGREIKYSYHLPPKNRKQYCTELKEALTFVKSANVSNSSDVEIIKNLSTYHHRGYIYLLTTEAENRIAHKISQKSWLELRKLSEEFEYSSNLFLSKFSKHNV